MSQQLAPVSVSAQIQQLTAALAVAYQRKEDGQAAVDAASKEIVAIRNVLAGIGLGQQLQKEIDVAQGAAQTPPEAPTK